MSYSATYIDEKGRSQTHPRAAGQHIRRGAARVADIASGLPARHKIDQHLANAVKVHRWSSFSLLSNRPAY